MRFFVAVVLFVAVALASNQAFAVKYVDGYYTKSGQYRSGHYKDTSGDGNPYNNANYLGYND